MSKNYISLETSLPCRADCQFLLELIGTLKRTLKKTCNKLSPDTITFGSVVQHSIGAIGVPDGIFAQIAYVKLYGMPSEKGRYEVDKMIFVIQTYQLDQSNLSYLFS
jgi:hypothetical protein